MWQRLMTRLAELIRRIKGYAIAFVTGAVSAAAALLWLVAKKRRAARYDDRGLVERQKDRAARADRERGENAAEAKQAQKREERQESAEELRDKILTGGLIVLLALGLLASTARATEPGPFIPEDYDTLRRYYLATWDLSEQYRALYLEAEKSAAELRESNTRLLEIISEQATEIETLREELKQVNSWRFGLLGGATWSPAGLGVFVGGSVQF
jgi:hypothetical protein